MKGDSRFRVVDGGMADTDNIKENIELGRNPKINSSIEGNGWSWERKGGNKLTERSLWKSNRNDLGSRKVPVTQLDELPFGSIASFCSFLSPFGARGSRVRLPTAWMMDYRAGQPR